MGFYEEKMAIIGVLEYTRNVLENLILRMEPEDRERFQEAWSYETRPQLEEAIGMLRGEPRREDIQSRAYQKYVARGRAHGREVEDWAEAQSELREELISDHGPLRRFLSRVGLAGKSLRLKLEYLAAAASAGWRGKFLNLLNKFLGSLAGGIPGAEATKELKEWLEGLIENQPEPDLGIKNAYIQAGLDPFWIETLKTTPQ